ncbi:MAG TPA: AAA family ATPase [Hyphomicrobium sp.]|nr:AAA family ATPase [Hyphomicrobium sp.]
MFFKRLTKDKSAPKTTPAPESEVRSETAKTTPESPAPDAKAGGQALASTELRRTVDSKALGFKTTADLKPATGLIGQDRALKALDFGLGMKARDFNIFVAGPPSSGKRTLVHAHLAKVAATSQTPSDWVYVNNFSDARRPRAIALPPGRARPLADGMASALRELTATLPAAFQSEDYRARRRAIDEDFHADQEDALQGIHLRAAQQNIAVLRTPLGFSMAPMHDGKVVKPEVFSQLPERMRRDVETRVATLQAELEAVLANGPKADKARRRQLTELNEEVARHAVEDALDPLSSAYTDVADVASFLADVEKDLVVNCDQFLKPDNDATRDPVGLASDPRCRRYLVNVIVSSADAKTGAPVRDATNETPDSLLGHIERASVHDGAAADFLSIRPGALHAANRGALMIDAKRILDAPFAWDALKRALNTGEIRIEPRETDASRAVRDLEPEPIPLLIKVILFGDADLFNTLEQTDPDFPRLFKVRADFDETISRSKESDAAYAGLIASIVAAHDLKPVDAGGVARIMEEAARIAEDREKLSIELGRIADIVREADYWSDSASRKTTTDEDVVRALDERTRRADRVRDDIHEQLERGIVMIDTAGKKAGQINALSLVQKGGFSFGRPARITARAHLGQGRVTDIEREVQLGGPFHSKGVMILWGYLAGRFAQDVPLALAATLVFEQSYETVEGDSASSAELIALLSALADAPLRQDLAITGSINQWGEVQAVGGINEKIEGFFDVCSARGLTGSQGVIIPDANRQHLMLREDAVNAVRDGRFAVHAVRTVDEALALLTGLDAGEKGADGRFGAETVNGRVDARLKAFAEKARAFPMGKDSVQKSAAGSA